MGRRRSAGLDPEPRMTACFRVTAAVDVFRPELALRRDRFTQARGGGFSCSLRSFGTVPLRACRRLDPSRSTPVAGGGSRPPDPEVSHPPGKPSPAASALKSVRRSEDPLDRPPPHVQALAPDALPPRRGGSIVRGAGGGRRWRGVWRGRGLIGWGYFSLVVTTNHCSFSHWEKVARSAG